MVNQLDKYWDVSSWPQRYQYSSFDLNYILVNGKRPSREGKHWTKKDVVDFMKWITKHSNATRKMILYRGTWDSPLPYWNNDNSNANHNLVSTSTSERIAKEFSNDGKGYVHILYLSPGCKTFDMKPYYTSSVRREKEILLLPGHQFAFLKKYGHRCHWLVTP